MPSPPFDQEIGAEYAHNLAAVNKVSITVENIDGVAFTTSDNNIHVSAGYIEKGRPPSGLVEGMADFVRLRADYAADSWDDVGEDPNWDQGYQGSQLLNFGLNALYDLNN
ncbi:uncharacterized protein LOC107467182 [Arachis duranensis]|uniref:Uncharacterized protein LOC107467182 n=1 Tax=Arachis duranensis TaxID=130453 RepID=A0A6P4BQU5_ARADU|nr:uncharacterized protein LOC107467182 [Arachis duranensis]